MGRLNKVLAGFLVFGLSASAPLAHAGEADQSVAPAEARELASFAASYRYAGGQTEKDKAVAAVEEIVAELNFMIRGMARKALKKSSSPKPSEHIKVDGDKVTLRLGDQHVTLVVGGAPVEHRGDDRKSYQMSLKHKGDKLVLKVTGSKSTTIKTYRLSEDGSRLKIKTRINHPMMHKPLVYKFSYRR